MNKILLTSLALFTFVNYNNSSATTGSLGDMDITGTVNLNKKDAYDIIGTCNVSGNGVLNATKPVSITNDSSAKAGNLKIDGATSNATFIGGLIVDGGTLDMDTASATDKQLHIVDNLTLKGSPTLTSVKAKMYTSKPGTNDTVTIKVSGLTGQINNFVIEPAKDSNVDASIDLPTIYLDYNSSELDLDTATTDEINAKKNTIQNTLTNLFQSQTGYLLNCDLSNYHIKNYITSRAAINAPEETSSGSYSISLRSEGSTLLDNALENIEALEDNKPVVDEVEAEVTSDVLPNFIVDANKNATDNKLVSWPSLVMPLSYKDEADATKNVGNENAEIRLDLTSPTPLKLSGGGITKTLTLSGNNSQLTEGIELHGDLASVEFGSANSVTDIDYLNVTTNNVSMGFLAGTSETSKTYTLSVAPTKANEQNLTMNIGAYSTLTFGGSDQTYDVSTLNMSANSKIVVNAGITLNA